MFLIACGSVATTHTISESNVIEIKQKLVPFTITVPTYFPEGFQPYPVAFSGPGQGVASDTSVVITFTYQEIGTTNLIFITEENYEVIPMPGGSSFTYLDIKGIKVLEQEVAQPWPDSSNLLKGLSYGWNQGGVNIDVKIYGYGQAESRKIIESMVK
jgi:hypothetical protein